MANFLPYIADAVVIFVFVLYLAKGWHRGLARTLLSMLSWVLALLLAWQLYGFVADFLRSIGLQDRIAAALPIEAPAQPAMAEASSFIEGLLLPDALKTSMVGNNNYEAYGALGVSSFVDYVRVFLANVVVNAIAVLLVFIVSLLLLKLISRWLGALNWIPLIGTVNRVLGLAAGGIIGLIVIQIWMFIFTMLATGQNIFSTFVMAIEQGTISSWFYHNNWIVDWITQILV